MRDRPGGKSTTCQRGGSWPDNDLGANYSDDPETVSRHRDIALRSDGAARRRPAVRAGEHEWRTRWVPAAAIEWQSASVEGTEFFYKWWCEGVGDRVALIRNAAMSDGWCNGGVLSMREVKTLRRDRWFRLDYDAIIEKYRKSAAKLDFTSHPHFHNLPFAKFAFSCVILQGSVCERTTASLIRRHKKKSFRTKEGILTVSKFLIYMLSRSARREADIFYVTFRKLTLSSLRLLQRISYECLRGNRDTITRGKNTRYFQKRTFPLKTEPYVAASEHDETWN